MDPMLSPSRGKHRKKVVQTDTMVTHSEENVRPQPSPWQHRMKRKEKVIEWLLKCDFEGAMMCRVEQKQKFFVRRYLENYAMKVVEEEGKVAMNEKEQSDDGEKKEKPVQQVSAETKRKRPSSSKDDKKKEGMFSKTASKRKTREKVTAEKHTLMCPICRKNIELCTLDELYRHFTKEVSGRMFHCPLCGQVIPAAVKTKRVELLMQHLCTVHTEFLSSDPGWTWALRLRSVRSKLLDCVGDTSPSHGDADITRKHKRKRTATK